MGENFPLSTGTTPSPSAKATTVRSSLCFLRQVSGFGTSFGPLLAYAAEVERHRDTLACTAEQLQALTLRQLQATRAPATGSWAAAAQLSEEIDSLRSQADYAAVVCGGMLRKSELKKQGLHGVGWVLSEDLCTEVIERSLSGYLSVLRMSLLSPTAAYASLLPPPSPTYIPRSLPVQPPRRGEGGQGPAPAPRPEAPQSAIVSLLLPEGHGWQHDDGNVDDDQEGRGEAEARSDDDDEEGLQEAEGHYYVDRE